MKELSERAKKDLEEFYRDKGFVAPRVSEICIFLILWIREIKSYELFLT